MSSKTFNKKRVCCNTRTLIRYDYANDDLPSKIDDIPQDNTLITNK